MEFAENRPRWEQVAEVIKERIKDGTYPVGSRLPSIVQLQSDYGIANITAQKVMRHLREQGLIETVSGMGSFVAKQK